MFSEVNIKYVWHNFITSLKVCAMNVRSFYSTVTGLLQFHSSPKCLQKNRFWFLWANLHLATNNNCLPWDHTDHDKLFKVSPMVDKLNDNFAECYEPHQQISVDESMVRSAHWLCGDVLLSNITFCDFCCFSCVMQPLSSLQTVLNCEVFKQ